MTTAIPNGSIARTFRPNSSKTQSLHGTDTINPALLPYTGCVTWQLWTGLLAGALAVVAQDQKLSDWPAGRVVGLRADVHHVQGIDVDRQTLWVSSVDVKAKKGYLSKFSLPDGRLVAQVEVQEGVRIHPGGITLDGESLWIPVAEYDRDGPTSVQRRNKHTLALESSFEVKDHIGCIAAGRQGLAGGSWGSRTIYLWTRTGMERWKKSNPSGTQYQDLKFDGELLVGSGNTDKTAGAVEWILLPNLQIVRRLVAGVTERGQPYTHEGMALRDGRLYLLPEDAPSRLFEFRRP